MTSTPVYTSTADGYRDAKEIAALRPMAPAKPKAPRKKSAPVSVATGIICFCGERFSEAQALEFMKHLRAEVGEDLALLERYRTKNRTAHRRRYADPEYRKMANARRRNRWAYDDEWREEQKAIQRGRQMTQEQRERKNAKQRERRADPEYREAATAYVRDRMANDPEFRQRQADTSARYRARKKAEREAQAATPASPS